MVAPLIHQGEVLGTVTAGRLLGEEEFEDQYLDLIDAIAHQAALAVHTQDLYAEQQRKSAEIKFELEEVSLDIDTLVPLGLVAMELIVNSLEYAFPRESEPGTPEGRILTLRFYQSAEAYHLEVLDNGEGMDEAGCPVGSDRGLGLCLVESMVEQLHAHLERIPTSGTGWKVTIPKQARGALTRTGATSS